MRGRGNDARSRAELKRRRPTLPTDLYGFALESLISLLNRCSSDGEQISSKIAALAFTKVMVSATQGFAEAQVTTDDVGSMDDRPPCSPLGSPLIRPRSSREVHPAALRLSSTGVPAMDETSSVGEETLEGNPSSTAPGFAL